MGLMLIGNLMRSVGLKGTAGSGLILSPNKAREDYKPWTKMAGGCLRMSWMKQKRHLQKQTSLK